jgi:hypothetical protein
LVEFFEVDPNLVAIWLFDRLVLSHSS